MKKYLFPKIVLFLAASSLTLIASAQKEKSEVQVKIIKDGEIVMDTTYTVEDEKATDVAVKMLDFTLGEKASKHGKHIYTFKSEDGQSYEWKSEGDGVHNLENHTYVFAEKGEEGEITIHMNEEGEKVVEKKVIVKKSDVDDDGQKSEVIIITGDEPEKIDLEGENIEWIEKGDHKILIINEGENRKKVKVITGDKENSSYNITTDDGKKIVIKEIEEGDDKEIEVEVTVNEEKGDIKKAKKKKEKN